ncbi:hypothetical protein DLNHIDIE_03381 [Acidithiobacillus thiooxidans ATCC 19377]|uniref:Uncharacterized protein n=1 Tax=Acidithiobacillus thiooxidans ATCC 19377 TaxID=637390 RepID=A0A543PZ20_ACITH|nr:hypothetical protein DLNHIDIE_03381 [Acidithiobacillus thiooxidans ATCC 19377]
MGLADPLVLVHGGDTAGVNANHDVGVGFFPGHLDLAVHGEAAGEFALGDDVPEAKATAVIPGGVVDDLGSQRLGDRGANCRAVATENAVVVNGVFRHHLVVMTGRMHGDPNIAHVDGLHFTGNTITHDVQPFTVVHDFFRNDNFAIDQTAELAEDLLDLFAQFGRFNQILANFLVVAEGGAAVDQWEKVTVFIAVLLAGDIGLMEVAQEDGGEGFNVANARAVIVPGGAGGLVGFVQVINTQVVHEPEQAGGIAGNVAALAAALVMPQIIGRNALIPTIQSIHIYGLMFIGNAVNNDFTFFFQCPHVLANVVHTLAQIYGTTVYVAAYPCCGRFCFVGR